MHLLSSDKISFSMAKWCKCLEHCCFSKKPFLKQLASHVSATTLQLKFIGMKFFLIHAGHLNIFFFEGFKVFCIVLMKEKSSHIKKIEKHDGKNVFC